MTRGMTCALQACVMFRVFRRLASLLVIASFVAVAAQPLCAASFANEMPAMPCSQGTQLSLNCCCEATAPTSTVPSASTVNATFIADQATAHVSTLAVPHTDLAAPIRERAGTHRAGPLVSLIILHSSLLL